MDLLWCKVFKLDSLCFRVVISVWKGISLTGGVSRLWTYWDTACMNLVNQKRLLSNVRDVFSAYKYWWGAVVYWGMGWCCAHWESVCVVMSQIAHGGLMCSVTSIFVQGHMPILWSECFPVFLWHSWQIVSSYEVYILKHLPCMCIQTNLHIWNIYGIWGAYFLLAHIWQKHGK